MFSRTLHGMMALAVALSIAFNLAGLWLSWVFDIASGATVILVAALVFLATGAVNMLAGRKRS
jgi:zinc transport system permease protein